MRGGVCLGAIATNRGEHIDSMWLVLAAACSYLLGYRFYAKFIAARVPTDKWIVFGHHFAAIAGPAPLVGPVLAATSRERCDGKLPGQMTRVEIGKVGGLVALVTVLLIMIVLLAVVGLVVVNALVGSPWGVIGMLAIGILIVRPELQMPSLTRFVDGNGPVFAGKIFPFCFITIACGAVSGFHALIASGTTP
ncbi:MAG TPA: carbon starvation CstA family protein, partial [Dongiaceae bacterium]|nr:carbon starvation CstA family protein [Dongiaceae bacterium]